VAQPSHRFHISNCDVEPHSQPTVPTVGQCCPVHHIDLHCTTCSGSTLRLYRSRSVCTCVRAWTSTLEVDELHVDRLMQDAYDCVEHSTAQTDTPDQHNASTAAHCTKTKCRHFQSCIVVGCCALAKSFIQNKPAAKPPNLHSALPHLPRSHILTPAQIHSTCGTFRTLALLTTVSATLCTPIARPAQAANAIHLPAVACRAVLSAWV
jgi:hypothetical protein